MQDKEWEEASRRAERPVVIHFVVCPHLPGSGALLNEDGQPVITNYSDVDWKGLAVLARSAIDEYAPKDVKVFVGDDAVDVMDVLNISTDTGQPLPGDGFEVRLPSVLAQLSMKDMRGGITKLIGKPVDIHRNNLLAGKRPPLGALIMSLKFSRVSQIIDYLDGSTDALFGHPAFVATYEGYRPKPTTGDMPPYLANWLRSQFGVVYGTECTVVAIERTFAD